MDETPRRRRATFLSWVTVLAIALVCIVVFAQAAFRDGVPWWYEAYLKWQSRHGLAWLPL